MIRNQGEFTTIKVCVEPLHPENHSKHFFIHLSVVFLTAGEGAGGKNNGVLDSIRHYVEDNCSHSVCGGICGQFQ